MPQVAVVEEDEGNTMKRNRYLIGMAAAVALTLSACGGGGGGESSPSNGAEGGLAGECNILQYETTTSAQYQGWMKGLDEFKAENPGLEVEWATTNFDAFRSNAKVLLSGGDVPDAVLVNTGNADAGQLAQQGLLEPLNDLVTENGWDEAIIGPVANLAIYDNNGHAGQGDWYGVPSTASYYTFYYNKDLLAEHGITQMPDTMAGLEAIFAQLVDEGVTPISSNAGEHGVLQTWWQLISGVADRSEIDNFILLQGESDITGGAFLEGTTHVDEWNKAGYLGTQLSGLKGDDMERAFIAGDMPFMASGTWSFNRVNQEAPFDWGMMLFPEQNLNAGTSGHLWAIPADADNKECGRAWIEKTMSPTVQNEIAQLGGIPVLGDPSVVTDDRAREMNETFQTLMAEEKLSYYPDYPVPGLLDVQMSGLQSLTSGSSTPEAFLDSMKQFYEAGLR